MSPKDNTLTGVMTVNAEQAQRAMMLCWKAEMECKKRGIPLWFPVILVGGTSTAKTTTVRGLVASLNNGLEEKEQFRLWLEHISYYADSGDIGGIPFPKDGKTQFLMNENLPFDNGHKGVLLLDEMDRVRDESIQNAMLQVVNGREIHGHKLSKSVFVVGTMNGTSDAGTLPLCEALRARTCTLFMSSRAAGVVDSYEAWAQANGISPVGLTFSRYRRELLRQNDDFEEIAIPVQRTVDMADFVLQASKSVKFKTDDILLPVIAGLVGKKAATEFLATEKLINEAPSIKAILADPDNADIPENVSVCYALACGLGDYAKSNGGTDRKVLDGLAKYICRMRPELGAMAFKRMSKEAPAVVTTPAFQNWAKSNKALLI